MMLVFDVMKKLKLLDWYTLLVGLERGWCKKENLISYGEECINQKADNEEIDNNLITIISEKSLSSDDLVAIVLKFLTAQKKPMQQDENFKAIEKWRLAHLYLLLQEENYSDQKKIDVLQELYAQFGFPDDMTACSIYSKDEIDPLTAAKNVVEKLSQQLCS